MDVFEKLAKINGWQLYIDWQQTFNFEMQGITAPTRLIPDEILLDIVLSNGLKSYILENNFDSQDEIKEFIFDTINLTLNSKAFSEKKTREVFPLLANFFYYCQKIDRGGSKDRESEKIAEQCWYGEMAAKRLNERINKMFSIEPDKIIFDEVVLKIKDIWDYSDIEIDSLRYFVCQSKDRGRTINPSQNKQIYLWSKTKETGKTSIARAIVSILNGEHNTHDASKFESTLGRELQYGAHDLPLAATYNAVILDEAMPNDSKKVYGQLKAMLTSSGCDYNPKFNTTIHVECHRNYIFTSNNCISDYIKDDSDRRFVIVEPKKKPKQIEFSEIYDIWKLFCIHATPRLSWAKWYSEFQHVEGQESKQIEENKANIINHTSILKELTDSDKYVVTLGFFCKKLTNSETPPTEIKRNIKASCIELFGNPIQKGGSTWKKSDVLKVIQDNTQKENDPLTTTQEETTLPF
jgi:hypothetical protein